MHKLITLNVFIFCFLIFSPSANAQDIEDDKKDSAAVLSWLTRSFSFDKPDTGFIQLPEGNGFRNNSLDATIKYISFPAKYPIVKSQFANPMSTESSLVIDTMKHIVNGSEAFSLITEEISPDKNKYENYITLKTIVDFNEITVCIVGAYPKSKDKLLQKKYIQAALSIKEE